MCNVKLESEYSLEEPEFAVQEECFDKLIIDCQVLTNLTINEPNHGMRLTNMWCGNFNASQVII